MPDIAHAIGRGIVGAGRAIRGSVQGGARQVTPTLPVDETVEVRGTDATTAKRNLLQRFGSKIKRDAQGSLAGRGIRALRNRRQQSRSKR